MSKKKQQLWTLGNIFLNKGETMAIFNKLSQKHIMPCTICGMIIYPDEE